MQTMVEAPLELVEEIAGTAVGRVHGQGLPQPGFGVVGVTRVERNPAPLHEGHGMRRLLGQNRVEERAGLLELAGGTVTSG